MTPSRAGVSNSKNHMPFELTQAALNDVAGLFSTKHNAPSQDLQHNHTELYKEFQKLLIAKINMIMGSKIATKQSSPVVLELMEDNTLKHLLS